MLVIVLYGVLPPIVAGLVLVALVGQRALGAALGLGMFAAFALLKGWPKWPHELWAGNNEGLQWFVWSVLSIAVATLCGRERPGRGATASAGVLALAAEVWLVLTVLRGRWETLPNVLHHGVAMAGIAATWLLMRRATRDRSGLPLAIVWALCLVADALVLERSGSILQAQLAGAVAAGLGGAAVPILRRGPFAFPAGATMAIAAGHGGLLLAGFVFSEMPLTAGLLMLFAPAAMVIGSFGEPRRGRTIAAVVVAGAMAAGAVGLAAAAAPG